MSNKWVVNASPLILLAKINQLTLLTQLTDELVIPESVVKEINVGAANDPARTWLQADGKRWIRPNAPAELALAAWDLGAGETAVLNWTYRHGNFEAILDDRAARRCAAIYGIPVRGTLGIILAAKQRGAISAAKPLCEALVKVGIRIDARILNKALHLVGEAPTL